MSKCKRVHGYQYDIILIKLFDQFIYIKIYTLYIRSCKKMSFRKLTYIANQTAYVIII